MSSDVASTPLITMVSATLIYSLLLSMTRKSVHKYYLVAFATLTILSIALPSLSTVSGTVLNTVKTLGDSEETVVVSTMGSTGNCTLVELTGVAVYRGFQLPLLRVPSSILSVEAMGFKPLGENCPLISVPEHMYTQRELVVLSNGEACPSYTHRYVEAVLVITDSVASNSSINICVQRRRDLVEAAYMHVMKGFHDATSTWLLLLTVLHTPLVYIAVSKTMDSLSEEMRTMRNLGVSRLKVLIYTAVSSTTLSTIVQVFLAALTTCFLLVLWRFLGVSWLSIQPNISYWMSVQVPLTLTSVFALSVALGASRHDYS